MILLPMYSFVFMIMLLWDETILFIPGFIRGFNQRIMTIRDLSIVCLFINLLIIFYRDLTLYVMGAGMKQSLYIHLLSFYWMLELKIHEAAVREKSWI